MKNLKPVLIIGAILALIAIGGFVAVSQSLTRTHQASAALEQTNAAISPLVDSALASDVDVDEILTRTTIKTLTRERLRILQQIVVKRRASEAKLKAALKPERVCAITVQRRCIKKPATRALRTAASPLLWIPLSTAKFI